MCVYVVLGCTDCQHQPVLCPFRSYVATATALDQETNGSVRNFDVCDNIDLDMVLREYESFHYIKFQKYPKVIRRRSTTGEHNTELSGSLPNPDLDLNLNLNYQLICSSLL